MAQRKPHNNQNIGKEDEGRLWRAQVIEANHKGGMTHRLYVEADHARPARRQREARLLQEEAARETAALQEDARRKAEKARIEEAQRLHARQLLEQQKKLEQQEQRREKQRISEEEALRIRRRKVEEQRRRMAEQKRRRIAQEKREDELERERRVPEQTKRSAGTQQERKQTQRSAGTQQERIQTQRSTAPQQARRQNQRSAAPKKAQKQKKVFTRGFKKGFWIAWGVFAALLIAALVLLWSFLNRYEKGLPEHYMAQVLESIETGKTEDLHIETADGKSIDDASIFVDKTKIIEYLQEKDKAGKLDFVKVNAESAGEENVYLIRSGEEQLLKVTIRRPEGSRSWKEIRSQLVGDAFQIRSITAQIPSSCTLEINGMEADRSFITEKKAQIEMLSELISSGIIGKQPTLDTYTVSGIFPGKAEVVMRNKKGKEVPCTLTENVYSAGFEAGKKFVNEQKQRVLSLFEPYALYFSGDANKQVLNNIMLIGSPAYESASSADVSWMQAHDGIEITDQEVSNFRKYSDECFSCDIRFSEKIMRGGEAVRTWDTNMTWIFVLDGDYYIADLITRTADD